MASTTVTSLSLAGAAVLIVILVCSFLYLQRLRAPAAVTAAPPNLRTLTGDEERVLRQRLERQAGRAQREREQEQHRQAVEMAKPSLYQDKLRKREESRLAEEEEQAQTRRAKEAHEAEEYAKWKSSLTVVGQENADTESGMRDTHSLQSFIAYVTDRKVVELEALASAFQLSIEQVIRRIGDLETQGMLYGLADERGRYYSIETQHVQAIRRTLNGRQSRISLEDLHRDLDGVIFADRVFLDDKTVGL